MRSFLPKNFLGARRCPQMVGPVSQKNAGYQPVFEQAQRPHLGGENPVTLGRSFQKRRRKMRKAVEAGGAAEDFAVGQAALAQPLKRRRGEASRAEFSSRDRRRAPSRRIFAAPCLKAEPGGSSKVHFAW